MLMFKNQNSKGLVEMIRVKVKNRNSKGSIKNLVAKTSVVDAISEATAEHEELTPVLGVCPCSICHRQFTHMTPFCRDEKDHVKCSIDKCDIVWSKNRLVGGYGSFEYDFSSIEVLKREGGYLKFRGKLFKLRNIRICNTCIVQLILDKAVQITHSLYGLEKLDTLSISKLYKQENK